MGLVIRHLSKTYFDAEAGRTVTALADVSLEIAAGEFVAILGPSGSGKTTLLNIVAGFLPPTSGEVLLNGRRIQGPGPDRGVVFQAFALFPWKTVLENVAFGLKMRGVPPAERERLAREYIELVGLQGFEHHYPHQLSGGMQQRVGVARVLANRPELMLMDEPFASVDAQTRMTLQEELARIWEARRPTVLFVTHDVEEAVFLAERVVVLTPRPARVAAVVPVDLPRPRTWQRLIEDDAYKRLVAHVFGLVRTAPAGPEPVPASGPRAPDEARPARPDPRPRPSGTWRVRLLRRLLLVAALVVAWQTALAVHAAGKLPPDLAERAGSRGTVDLLVTLRFPPERFHVLVFQRFGRVSGTRGEAVEVRSVPVGRVREIARFYWVRAITMLEEEGR